MSIKKVEPRFYAWAERTGYFSPEHHLWAFQSGGGFILVDAAGRVQTWNADRRADTIDDGTALVHRTREAAEVWAEDMRAIHGWELAPRALLAAPPGGPAS